VLSFVLLGYTLSLILTLHSIPRVTAVVFIAASLFSTLPIVNFGLALVSYAAVAESI
jgi:hypothetical protein